MSRTVEKSHAASPNQECNNSSQIKQMQVLCSRVARHSTPPNAAFTGRKARALPCSPRRANNRAAGKRGFEPVTRNRACQGPKIFGRSSAADFNTSTSNLDGKPLNTINPKFLPLVSPKRAINISNDGRRALLPFDPARFRAPRSVDLAALANERRDIEVVVLHGALDGLRHGGEVWGFTHRRGYAGGHGSVAPASSIHSALHDRSRGLLHLVSRGGAGIGDGRLRRRDHAVLALDIVLEPRGDHGDFQIVFHVLVL